MSLLKKIFITSSILFLITLFFGGIYFFAFKNETSSNSNTTENQPASSIKSISTEILSKKTIQNDFSIIALSDEPVLAPVLINNDLNIKYYAKNDGKVYKIDLEGKNKQILSDKVLIGLSDVFWSPDKTKVITKFKNIEGQSQFYFYDYATSSSAALNRNIDTVVWRNNTKIIYKHFDPKTRKGSLNISDPDGKNWTKLADAQIKYLSIAPVPMSGFISFWNKPDANMETTLSSVSVLEGEIQTLFKGTFGTDYLWSNNGNYILASSLDKRGGAKINLSLLNNKGENNKEMRIPTMAYKCVWSKDNQTIYYALPSGISDNFVMPNDYMDGKINTTDTFWKVNIATGEKSRIISLDKIKNQFDAINLFLNSDESVLFFINRLDGKLYKIIL